MMIFLIDEDEHGLTESLTLEKRVTWMEILLDMVGTYDAQLSESRCRTEWFCEAYLVKIVHLYYCLYSIEK